MKLYEWAYSQYRMHAVSEKGMELSRIPVISGLADSVVVRCGEDFSLLLNKDDEIETKVYLPKFIYAPVMENEVAGTIEVWVNGELVKTIPLLYSETIGLDEEMKLDFWGRLKHWWIIANLQEAKLRFTY